MTTVYMNVRKGVAYADSRTTTVQRTKKFSVLSAISKKTKIEEKILSFSDSQKLYKVNNCIVATVGDTDVSSKLFKLFTVGCNPLDFPHFVSENTDKDSSGRILILRQGYVISLAFEKGKFKKSTYFCEWLTSGSGKDKGPLTQASGYMWKLTKEQIYKVLRLNSLFDVYSDDKIVSLSVNGE